MTWNRRNIDVDSTWCAHWDVYGGRDWYTGEYWHASLTESIRYSENTHLEQRKNELGFFPPITLDLNCPDIKLSDVK